MEALVSVIIPCYNQGEFLSESLESVVAQSYSNWECFIINDGSNDNTEEVSKFWTSKDRRINYVHKENGGPSAARNAGILLAKGEYILPLDADDIISPEYMAKAMKVFSENSNTDLVYCRADYFGKDKGEWFLPPYSYKALILQNMIFCSCFYKREAAISAGLYDEELKLGVEDWEFHLRLLNENSIVCQINEILFHYRIRDTSRHKVWQTSEKKFDLIKEKICKNQASSLTKFYGDWISLIHENIKLKEEVQMTKNFIPKRNFKNFLKFLLRRKINFH